MKYLQFKEEENCNPLQKKAANPWCITWVGVFVSEMHVAIKVMLFFCFFVFFKVILKGKCTDPRMESWSINVSAVIIILTADAA